MKIVHLKRKLHLVVKTLRTEALCIRIGDNTEICIERKLMILTDVWKDMKPESFLRYGITPAYSIISEG